MRSSWYGFLYIRLLFKYGVVRVSVFCWAEKKEHTNINSYISKVIQRKNWTYYTLSRVTN
jgi:hypothetical protein